jgi:hypothetical protein
MTKILNSLSVSGTSSNNRALGVTGGFVSINDNVIIGGLTTSAKFHINGTNSNLFHISMTGSPLLSFLNTGNLLIGTMSDTGAKMVLAGATSGPLLKINNTNTGAGKILVSDATGNMNWSNSVYVYDGVNKITLGGLTYSDNTNNKVLIVGSYSSTNVRNISLRVNTYPITSDSTIDVGQPSLTGKSILSVSSWSQSGTVPTGLNYLVTIGAIGVSSSGYTSTSVLGVTADAREISSGIYSDEWINWETSQTNTPSYSGEVLRVHGNHDSSLVAVFSSRANSLGLSNSVPATHKNYRLVDISRNDSDGIINVYGTVNNYAKLSNNSLNFVKFDASLPECELKALSTSNITQNITIGFPSASTTANKNFISIYPNQAALSLNSVIWVDISDNFATSDREKRGITNIFRSDWSNDTGVVRMSGMLPLPDLTPFTFVGAGTANSLTTGSIMPSNYMRGHGSIFNILNVGTFSGYGGVLTVLTASSATCSVYYSFSASTSYSATTADIFKVTGSGNIYGGNMVLGIPQVFDINKFYTLGVKIARYHVPPRAILHLGISSTASAQIRLDSVLAFSSSVLSVDPTSIKRGDIMYTYTGSMSNPFLGIGVSDGIKSYISTYQQVTITQSYNATWSNETILVNSSLTASKITLPLSNSVPAGKKIYIIDTGSASVNNITITHSGTNSVYPLTGNSITTDYSTIFYEADGNNSWYRYSSGSTYFGNTGEIAYFNSNNNIAGLSNIRFTSNILSLTGSVSVSDGITVSGTSSFNGLNSIFNIRQQSEVCNYYDTVSGNTNFTYSNASINWINSITSTFSVYLIGVPTASNRVQNFTFILNPTPGSYSLNSRWFNPLEININGSTQTVNWSNGSSPNPLDYDQYYTTIGYSLIMATQSSWVVFANHSRYSPQL